MKTFQFKTNIHCGGCVSGVTPFLSQLTGIEWTVDTESADKILTVSSETITEEDVIQAVKKAGFEIEEI